jgi:hypothetical protein
VSDECDAFSYFYIYNYFFLDKYLCKTKLNNKMRHLRHLHHHASGTNDLELLGTGQFTLKVSKPEFQIPRHGTRDQPYQSHQKAFSICASGLVSLSSMPR